MIRGNILPSDKLRKRGHGQGSPHNWNRQERQFRAYTYSITGSYAQAANVPIFDVTWCDAARFCNWLQNGQPTGAEGPGTTETGAYTLNGATGGAALAVVNRNPGRDLFPPLAGRMV